MFLQELQHWICLASIFWHQKNLVWFISSIKYQDYPFISRFLLYLDEIDEFSIAGKLWFSESTFAKWTWSCSGDSVLQHLYLASLDSHWLLYVLVLGCCNTRPIFGKSSHTLIARLSCGDFVDFVCLYSEYSHAIFGEDCPAKVLVFMVHYHAING